MSQVSFKSFLKFLIPVFFIFSNSHCGTSVVTVPNLVFTEVGVSFGTSDLIDLEFLPDQEGELIVIGKDGTVYYVKSDFTPLSLTATISVLDSGEQGLLNVVADPDYVSNLFIYLYYTTSDGSQNQVDRFTVTVNADMGTFSLSDQQTIIAFPKSDSSSSGTNHNGGSLVFDEDGNLMIGVGDGGGNASEDIDEGISQNVMTRLGKVLRIVPSQTDGSGGFSIPTGGNNNISGALPEIYALGLRNPFTMAYGNSSLFIGDVGLDTYEEIDVATTGGLNFGWPETEGPTTDSDFVTPLHGYAKNDDSFNNEDSDAVATGARSIMVLNFYNGDQYNGMLNRRLIYSEFYVGWVRGLRLDLNNNIVSDEHLIHLAGMTSLQEGPDGFLYAVSLFGSDQILRLDVR